MRLLPFDRGIIMNCENTFDNFESFILSQNDNTKVEIVANDKPITAEAYKSYAELTAPPTVTPADSLSFMEDDYQRMIIAGCLRDDEFCEYVTSYLDPDHFRSHYKTFYHVIKEQYLKTGGRCHPSMLLAAANSKIEKEEQKPQIEKALRDAIQLTPSHFDVLKDKIQQHRAWKKCAQAMAHMQEESKKGTDAMQVVDKVYDFLQQIEVEADMIDLVSLDEIMETQPAPYLVKGHLDCGKVCVVYGQSQSKKSFYAIDMLLSVVHGVPFLGQHITKQGKVVYCCAEGEDAIGKRMHGWYSKHQHLDYRDAAGDLLMQRRTIEFSNPAHVANLIQHIKRKFKSEKPKLVVIDTLARFLGGSDRDDKDVEKFYLGIQKLQKEFGCAVVVVHHVGHTNQDRARGAGNIGNNADHMIQLNAQPNSRLIWVEQKKQKDSSITEPYVLHGLVVLTPFYDEDGIQLDTLQLHYAEKQPELGWNEGQYRKEVEAPAVDESFATFVSVWGTDEFRRKDLCKALGKDNGSIDKMLGRWSKSGLIVKSEGGYIFSAEGNTGLQFLE